MSAALSPDQFDQMPQFDPEFADLMSHAVTPQDVLAVYQAMYKKNQTSGAVPGMLSVQELTTDQVRLAFQICNEMNKVEQRLGVEITDDLYEQRISKPMAALYRATVLSVALRGSMVEEKTNFWKVGTIVMSLIAVGALLALAIH